MEGKRHIPAAVNRVSVGRVHLNGLSTKRFGKFRLERSSRYSGGAAGECPSRRQAIHGVHAVGAFPMWSLP